MTESSFFQDPKPVTPLETAYRRIQTSIPVPESIPLLKKMYRFESRSMHGQMPIIWDRAEGFQVYDAWGNKWIDFTSTIFVANAGHGNTRIISALRKLLDKPLLHTYSYANSERIEYLEYLINNTPKQFEKAFLLSAGTEATEAALKLMRLRGINRKKRNCGVLCFEGNWHGRTLGAQMMSWNADQKKWIGYTDPNIHHLAFPYPWRDEALKNPQEFFQIQLKKLIKNKKLEPSKDLCGVMMETFQGWGAVFYPKEFVQEVVSFAHANDMLVTFDEMQAGFGRTGKLFGYMHYNVEPDILCCGKGASSGLPLSIVLGSKDIMDGPDKGSMSSTHSANPLSCAAGKANLETLLEDGLIDNSYELGKIFHKKLHEIQARFPDQIGYVLGKGLLAALIFVDSEGKPLSRLCDQVCELAMQRGLLVVHTGRESIKLAPPLCIHEDALIEGLAVLESCIKEVVRKG